MSQSGINSTAKIRKRAQDQITDEKIDLSSPEPNDGIKKIPVAQGDEQFLSPQVTHTISIEELLG
ncbi:MAG: hypothetical protein ABII72_02915 [Parcubacteria group bacterium]